MKLLGTKRWVAYTLIVWLGGLGCLAGCFAEAYAAPAAHAEHAQAVPEDSDCTDGCCKKNGSESDSEPHPTQDMDCCLYLSAPPVTLAKKATAPSPETALVLASSPAQSVATAVSFEFSQSPPVDSSGIYLRIRVLRI